MFQLGTLVRLAGGYGNNPPLGTIERPSLDGKGYIVSVVIMGGYVFCYYPKEDLEVV